MVAKMAKGKEAMATMRMNMSCFIFGFAKVTVALRLAQEDL